MAASYLVPERIKDEEAQIRKRLTDENFNSFPFKIFRSKLPLFQFKKWHCLVLVLALLLFGLLQINAFTQPLAKDMDKFLGGSTSSELFRYFDRFWNQITPGNDGKWGAVEIV